MTSTINVDPMYPRLPAEKHDMLTMRESTDLLVAECAAQRRSEIPYRPMPPRPRRMGAQDFKD